MEQILKVKCPHCGWIRSVDVPAIEDSGMSSVTAGAKGELTKVAEAIKNYMGNRALVDANAWVDMAACSNCHKVYRYNVKTREVKP